MNGYEYACWGVGAVTIGTIFLFGLCLLGSMLWSGLIVNIKKVREAVKRDLLNEEATELAKTWPNLPYVHK